MNLQELFRRLFNHPSTLKDLWITEERSKQFMNTTIDVWRDSLQNPFALACVLSSQIHAADARRKEQEQKAAATSSAAIERKALEEARARAPPAGHFSQVIETCIRVAGGMGGRKIGWVVCEVWVDRWAEGEGKGRVWV
jgi:hypothetical protein